MLTSERVPTRIVFNFGHRCNMRCEWCYVPFMGGLPSEGTCKRIVERVAQVGFKVITFGGGDPLLYSFLPQLIESAHKRGVFVHVDTNGIGLQCNNETAALIRGCVDLLGLPLDGPRREIHDRMRSAKSHFELVLSKLGWLVPFRQKIKINTFVSSRNVEMLGEMIPLIEALGPGRWSLYQYWPLSLGKAAVKDDFISEERFSTVVSGLPDVIGQTRLELNAIPDRRLTYPFVSHEGSVYIHHPTDLSQYQVLGSIFDDSVMTDLFARCAGERDNARSRYSQNEGHT